MENPVIAAPGHKLYAGVDFTRGRWGVSTGVQYIKDLYTNVSKGKEKKESFVLWNCVPIIVYADMPMSLYEGKPAGATLRNKRRLSDA